jgi:gliding motility-associated-like protein
MNGTFSFGFSFFFMLFYSINSNAQLEAHQIGVDGWAKGNRVEIGINDKGVYGADFNNKPASFHDNRDGTYSGLFGFIANPLNDGWVDFDGDFFTPGSPEEGFGIEIDNINYNNNNEQDLKQIAGGVTSVNVISSDCYEDIAQITWEGTVDGISIKRYYSITQNGLFIQMMTFIKNTSNETKANVHFLHNVDPDNNQSLSGNFETDMNLISQASSTADNICLVTASQNPVGGPLDTDGSHVSLYSNDDRARVTYGGFANRDAGAIWNGTEPGVINTEGSTASSVDEAISIAFKLGDLAPQEISTFVYYYILEEIDDTFSPFIVNITSENPATCMGNNGKISISGLNAFEDYTIEYFDDGILIPAEVYTANDHGIIEITNLNAGLYTNFSITSSVCANNVNSIFELTDPVVPDFNISKSDLTRCDIDNGTITLTALIPNVDYTISYHYNSSLITASHASNNNGEIIISNLPAGEYTLFSAEIYNCEKTNSTSIELLLPDIPTAFPPGVQNYCSEDYNASVTINLLEISPMVIGTQDPTDLTVTFHTTFQDAEDSIDLPYAYPTTGYATVVLFAKITNDQTNCFAITSFTMFIGSPPVFELEDGHICLDSNGDINNNYPNPTFYTELSASAHTFEWYLNGVLLPGETGNQYTPTTAGVYSCKATNIISSCHITNSGTISLSGLPQTLDVNITSQPFSDNHTVEITAIGPGMYAYKMNDGLYQTSPIFSNIQPGYHVFYINDINGCGEVSVDKIIIDYPKFFTPNEDGYNDYWQIIGVRSLLNPRVYIFDRYGKAIKYLGPNDIGWDGKYNDKNLPSTDYWFKVVFLDINNNEREFSAHFSLKR